MVESDDVADVADVPDSDDPSVDDTPVPEDVGPVGLLGTMIM